MTVAAEETEAERREARNRDIARRDAEMAAREPNPFDSTPPMYPDVDLGTDWRVVPKGWYALPVCDWMIFCDMVGPDDGNEPEPVAPLMGYLLVARKVCRSSRGRITGRDGLAPVRLVAAEHAVAGVGLANLTPYQRLYEEIEGDYHAADHPECDSPPVEERGGLYYQKPGYCLWHYGHVGERRWGFPSTREGAERWRNEVAVMVLEDIKEHGVSRYQALYGQLTGKCGRCGRLLTDPGSRSLGIGPDCRGSR